MKKIVMEPSYIRTCGGENPVPRQELEYGVSPNMDARKSGHPHRA
jgi:hypothetical protein